MPGTAAEILDDRVREHICPDKLKSEEWLDVIRTAHRVGINTTSTIMFGHQESVKDWSTHLVKLRELQKETQGITEFIPLPFVSMEFIKKAQRFPVLRDTLYNELLNSDYETIDGMELFMNSAHPAY